MKVFIAGAGGIGSAAGLILANSPEVEATIYIGDVSQQILDQTERFIVEGSVHPTDVRMVLMPMEGANETLNEALIDSDVILDCLPGKQAPRMAGLALENNCHYANLTEYVAETNQIMEMAKSAEKGFCLQTGLAPGFINVLANKLYQQFVDLFQVEVVDEITMKVGALSDHAPSPHFYAFTWSPIGVATEYIKDAVVVKDFKTQSIPALSGTDKIIIDGELYEDNFTSGGAADLPQAFDGKVKDLHYKTLRHPGHYAWVNSVIEGLENNESKIRSLEDKMLKTIGRVEDDNVVVYASVMGKDSHGDLRRLEKSYKVKPSVVGKRTLRAIQTTTAAPLCEMAYHMVKNNSKGIILQSQVNTDDFLNGVFVKAIYGEF